MSDPFSHPLDFSDRRVKEVRSVLASSLYRTPEIEDVAVSAGVPPQNLDWGQPARLLWKDVLAEAAKQQRLSEVIDRAIEVVPALQQRIAEIRAAEPLLAATIPSADAVAKPAWKNFAGGGRERQIVEGDDTLLDISFLQRGLDKAAAVCRLTVKLETGLFCGTGFRIGASTLLTNHHVLYDWDAGHAPAQSCLAEFGYETDVDGRLLKPAAINCDVAKMRGERAHDYAVIETAEPLPDAISQLTLAPSRAVVRDDRVLIVQHPQGLPKKIALAHNLVRYVDDDVVQYWTDTLGGSSGAPVFNEHWEVVALHHYWLEAPPDDGNAFRNQGRNIRRIAEQLGATGGGS